jgi:eukaryotic-like serine/threonine-protein kinase
MSDDQVLREAKERVGTVLGGKYHIDSVLGVGGMAVVYAATHRNRKRFAVKVLHAELSVSRDIRARFLREGYVANSVSHQGVVAVLDDDVDADGSAFLVMELLDGATVDALGSRLGGRLPVREALSVSHQLLDVLAVAHERAIIHRDIKPANLFVARDGHVKVLDFGIARLRDVTAGVQSTRAGAIVGTPSFMAPEQALAQGDEIDPRTDVWAAGAVLFTMISGQFVHEGDNARQLMIRAATVPARSLADVAPDTPSAVVELVAKALEFDKAARWESAVEMREAVARIREELFGPFAHEHLKECLEKASGEFETACAEPSPGEASSVPSTGEVVKIASPAGTTPESLNARRLDGESDVATTTSKPVSNRGAERGPRRRRTAVVALVAVVAGLAAGSLAMRYVTKSPPDYPASASKGHAPLAQSTVALALQTPAPVVKEVPSTSPSVHESSASGTAATAAPTAPRPSTRAGATAPTPPKADAVPSATRARSRQRDPLEIEFQ